MANATYVGVNGVARKVSKKYVGVDSVARKISKGYVGVDGVARKFFGGEPWQEAAALVGYSPASLDALLKDSTICTAIAGNSTAYGIMKNNYSSTMTSYIDSNFNNGLNLLNFRCKLKCYLYRPGNECTNITTEWVTQMGEASYRSDGIKFTISSSEMTMVRTSAAINFTGFNKFTAVVNAKWEDKGENLKAGTSTYANLNSDKGVSWVDYNAATAPGATTQNGCQITCGLSNSQGSYYVKLSEYMWSNMACTWTHVYITP